jgi:hypothetical protein
MYFALIFGALNLMHWVMRAANCLVTAPPRRQGISDVRFQGTQQF